MAPRMGTVAKKSMANGSLAKKPMAKKLGGERGSGKSERRNKKYMKLNKSLGDAIHIKKTPSALLREGLKTN